jgi:hypothetical protein
VQQFRRRGEAFHFAQRGRKIRGRRDKRPDARAKNEQPFRHQIRDDFIGRDAADAVKADQLAFREKALIRAI